MIPFARIAGGSPSSTKAVTNHLLNNTIGQEQSILGAYYGRGMVQEPLMVEIAHAVADGSLSYREGIDILHLDYLEKHPASAVDRDMQDFYNPIDPVEQRLAHRLDVLSDRIQEGLLDGPLAVVRPDIHPIVLAGLGIEADGLLSRSEIDALLAGRMADGSSIEGKTYASRRALPINPKDGEQRHSTPIGSYDFCPSPDKSVSVGWAFADPVEQAMIYNAHITAAREAVGYIAAEVGKARIGDGGNGGFEQGHVGWLEFTHHTGRRTQFTIKDGELTISTDGGSPGDPDLHTHFLIPNAVFCESGRVGSLDTAAVRGFILEGDAYYQMRLNKHLTDAGFATHVDQRTGATWLSHVHDSMRTLFSKRSNIGELLARTQTADRGEVWDELSQVQREKRIKAAVQSPEQRRKGGKDDLADVADWKRQAKEFGGWEPTTFQLYGPPPPPMTQEQRCRIAYEAALPFLDEKFQHKAVLTQWDARGAAMRGLTHTGGGDLADVAAVTTTMRKEGVTQYGEKTAMVWGQEIGQRYTAITTALHEAQEKEFIALAKAAAADRSTALPGQLLRQTIAQSGLDFTGGHGASQRNAIERTGMGGRFAVVIAAAGAGKTTALQPLTAAWQKQGRDVHGSSVAWRQADDLTNAGIDSRNVHAFSVMLDRLRDGSLQLTPKSVVAVDEWGLVGTRQALELLRYREQMGFTIVALGDDKQAASISAGSIIDLSRRALGVEQVPEILTTLRQQTERERLIVGLFREGRAAEALDMKRSDGTAEMVHGGYNEVVARVAKLYAERLQATGEAPSISTPTNTDAHRISEAVRLERRALGHIGDDIRTLKATDGERNYDLALAKGDRVRLFRSVGGDFGDSRGGTIGRNGTVLEVVDMTERGLVLKAASGRVGTVKWDDLTKNGRTLLAYGDVRTIHTAQGSTANEHIFALPAGSKAIDGNLGYSANTRHRNVAYLVTNETAERIGVQERRPMNDTHEVTPDDKWANVARSLSYQPVKDTAMAMLERIQEIRRGSVVAFHRVLHPGEEQRRHGQAPSMGHEVVAARKVGIAMERVRAFTHDIRQRVVEGLKPSGPQMRM